MFLTKKSTILVAILANTVNKKSWNFKRLDLQELTFCSKNSTPRLSIITVPNIAVGGGGQGGRSPPHSVQNDENRRKFGQMVYLFGQIVWIFGHSIGKIASQFRWRPFFFFFFLENTSIWTEKNVSILTEKRNASSHFSGKSLLPPQIILSSYGHGAKTVLLNLYQIKSPP